MNNYAIVLQFLQALRMILDIIIVWIILYYVIRLVRSNTRTVQIFKGIFFIIVIQAVAKYFGFDTLAYLTDNIVNWGFLALIIIFQPEIRGVLERFGKTNVFNRMNTLSGTEKENLVQALIDAAANLSESKTGALITIEQSVPLTEYVQTGVPMNSVVTAELLCAIFQTTTPLHDGAVIIQGDRIASASVYFPPTTMDLPSIYGARHRAAIGISEMTDAVTIVVSEETGRVAVAEQGKLIKVNEKKLRNYLNRVILNRETVMDEKNASMSARSVSIDELFQKESTAVNEQIAKQEAEKKAEEEKKEPQKPAKSVVIIDETKDDLNTPPVVHKAQMKTFMTQDFHADLDNAADAPKEKKEEAAQAKKEGPEAEKASGRKGLFSFLRQDKKPTAVEQAVKEVVQDYTTQQLKLREIQRANEELEMTRKMKLSQTKKVTVPGQAAGSTARMHASGTLSSIPKPSSGKAGAKDAAKTDTAGQGMPSIRKVKIASIDIPESRKVEITDLPPVKPIEITRVTRREAETRSDASGHAKGTGSSEAGKEKKR